MTTHKRVIYANGKSWYDPKDVSSKEDVTYEFVDDDYYEFGPLPSTKTSLTFVAFGVFVIVIYSLSFMICYLLS